ncbi:predicted protein [Botrytis cinerea T4]|uniref:Uncharacterized protein n=1 Tax=Botryotinia fuckeliana (strain T4) TaxID=999810 RepID=G2YD59_BOTF4|nr:predicted protein [Botrytis cinerea T4]
MDDAINSETANPKKSIEIRNTSRSALCSLREAHLKQLLIHWTQKSVCWVKHGLEDLEISKSPYIQRQFPDNHRFTLTAL